MEWSEQRNTTNGGYCVCVACGTWIPCQNWTTCLGFRCPNCGSIMVRDGNSQHTYQLQQEVVPDLRSDSTRRCSMWQHPHHPLGGECKFS